MFFYPKKSLRPPTSSEAIIEKLTGTLIPLEELRNARVFKDDIMQRWDSVRSYKSDK